MYRMLGIVVRILLGKGTLERLTDAIVGGDIE